MHLHACPDCGTPAIAGTECPTCGAAPSSLGSTAKKAVATALFLATAGCVYGVPDYDAGPQPDSGTRDAAAAHDAGDASASDDAGTSDDAGATDDAGT